MATNIKWRAPQLMKLVDAEMNKRLNKAAIHVKNEIKKNISIKGVRCGKGESTGVRSQPGEPPHIECGELRRSIAHEVDSRNKTAKVGSNKKYARHLELGTSKMAARPFLRPTLNEQSNAIRRIMLGQKIKGL